MARLATRGRIRSSSIAAGRPRIAHIHPPSSRILPRSFRHPAVIPRPREDGGLRPTRIQRNAYAANQEPEEPRRHRSSAARLYDSGLSLGDGEAESDEEFSEFVKFGRRERQGRGTGVADVHSHDLHHALLDAGLTA